MFALFYLVVLLLPVLKTLLLDFMEKTTSFNISAHTLISAEWRCFMEEYTVFKRTGGIIPEPAETISRFFFIGVIIGPSGNLFMNDVHVAHMLPDIFRV